jgi:two-component system aerobic respiration control sensor histidine kinase ArcB
VHAPAVAEEVEDTFENDDMPLPALHVLLVEDIELNVIVARSVLEKLGNSVDVAMTGKAALEMFKPGEYDLVLLDIQLPDMTGLDISRELTRQYAADELPPLVALTANVLKDKKVSRCRYGRCAQQAAGGACSDRHDQEVLGYP